MTLKRPSVKEVEIRDEFWSPYLDRIVKVMLPNVFDRMESSGYLQNFADVANGINRHEGPPFSDGLLLEAIRGASDFLAIKYDATLDARLDRYIDIIARASEKTGDGYLSTQTVTQTPQNRWGMNDGDIILTHDLYNHGALIEAAISHYLATGKTALLTAAVRAANTICREIGPEPKWNIVPGHSLPEEAFVKLYRLFRDHRELDGFAEQNAVAKNDFLEMAKFWYAARGNHRGRVLSHELPPYYSQDHLPFIKQTKAVGHAVRACLCYTGAAALTAETEDPAMLRTLHALWRDVYTRKMHISGGVGTRKDIEAFDEPYNLPNNAYLETCASVSFAFWSGEMNRLDRKAEYYDAFERALCNNILASISQDGKKYFYRNPLESNGNKHRWEWHTCPCCPPMLLKFFSSLGTYIYSIAGNDIFLNLFIGSTYRANGFTIAQDDSHCVTVTVSDGQARNLLIRIPDYAGSFRISRDGKQIAFRRIKGYALVPVKSGETTLQVEFESKPRRVCANTRVNADLDRVCIMNGPFVMCAEGIDNGGTANIYLPPEVKFEVEGDEITGIGVDGKPFRLIPYYRWANRCEEDCDNARMRVWHFQRGMLPKDILAKRMGNRLYADYDALL